MPSALAALLVAAAALAGCATSRQPAPAPPVATTTAAPATTTAAADPGPRCTQTAAARYGWGAPTRESDFDHGLPPDWHPYGPEPGHERRGERTPAAITVADGAVTIDGTATGTTGAMSWHPGQKYGRWEACVKSDAGRGGLNAVILLWPVAEDWPVGGEIDWMEIMDPTRQVTGFHLHYGADNQQSAADVTHDATQWTAWALEWTPQKITGYVNGAPWYTSTNTAAFPPRPMVMTMQLDYFPPAGGPSAMHMDWARQWALPQSVPATLSLAPGDPATGQPPLYPGRTPRPLGAGQAPGPR